MPQPAAEYPGVLPARAGSLFPRRLHPSCQDAGPGPLSPPDLGPTLGPRASHTALPHGALHVLDVPSVPFSPEGLPGRPLPSPSEVSVQFLCRMSLALAFSVSSLLAGRS